MENPLVSVLIPVYNAGNYLRKSVDSILNQTYLNLEVIIIDDGSDDGYSEELKKIKDPRLSIIYQENSGKSVALNKGLSLLSGSFYTVQDADDLSYPTRIERLLSVMQADSGLAAVFSGHDLILGNRNFAPRSSGKSTVECHKDIEMMRMPAHDPTGFYRVNLVSDIRYEASLRIGQGIDYILRVGEIYPIKVLGECLYSYRIHSSSGTRRNAEKRIKAVKEVHKRAAIRRGLDYNEIIEHLKLGSSKEVEYGVVPHCMESVLDFRRSGRINGAIKTAFHCLFLHPWNLSYYKPMIYALLPTFFIDYYRKIFKSSEKFFKD